MFVHEGEQLEPVLAGLVLGPQYSGKKLAGLAIPFSQPASRYSACFVVFAIASIAGCHGTRAAMKVPKSSRVAMPGGGGLPFLRTSRTSVLLVQLCRPKMVTLKSSAVYITVSGSQGRANTASS
jgi:hypothetical protein